MHKGRSKDTTIKIVVGLLAAGLVVYFSFTAFYSIAYLLLIAATASQLRAIQAFSSYVSRMVLAGLLLGAAIMIAGLLSWLIGSELHPLLVATVYFLFFLLSTRIATRTQPPTLSSVKIIDRDDILAIGLSVIGPLILLGSFGFSPASMLQIANEGWDNGSHVLMLQDASLYKGYLYGNSPDVIKKVIYNSNAYPQAWHLASANIPNGFGHSNVFAPDKPVRTTYIYIATVLIWLMIAAYVFTRTSLYVASRFIKRRLSSVPEFALFAVVNILIQMIVLWGSFNSGFSNFIGMLAYLSILIASLLGDTERLRSSIMGAIAGTAAILCWFLPLPAVLIILLISCSAAVGIKNIRQLFTKVGKQHAIVFTIVTLATIISIGQVLIFILFASVSGGDQLNEGVAISATDSVNGVFPVSQIFLVIITLFTLWYWWKFSKKVSPVLLSIVPFVSLVIAIYIYQEVSSGYTSYYLSKTMGIALIPIGIFLAPAFTFWIFDTFTKHRAGKLATLGIGVFATGLVLLVSNQSFYGASHLLEKNTRVNKSTAEAIVHFLSTADQRKEDIIVMRKDPKKPYEDRNGRFEMRVVHKKLGCAYTVRNADALLDEWLERLKNCATRDARRGHTLTVITSPRTTQPVKDLGMPNIEVVEVPDDITKK